MKRTLFIILSVVVVFLMIGAVFTGLLGPRSANTFSSVDYGPGFGGGAPDMAQAPVPPAEYDAYDTEESARSSVGNDAAQPQTQERLVIQTADLSIVVQDPKARMAEIGDIAQEMDGFVVSSNSYQNFSNGREFPQAAIAIRVPSERLDEALAQIKEGAIDVPTENRSGQDVTSQYVDLQAQLKAKQAAEQQLLEIMEQATRAEDVLAIYLEVQNIQTQIEQLKGQIQYYDEAVAMSLINVTLLAEEGTQPLEVGPWTLEGTAKDAIQDLIFFFQNFVAFLVRFVLYVLPALILIAIPLYLVFLAGRALYRRSNKAQVVAEDKRDEIKG